MNEIILRRVKEKLSGLPCGKNFAVVLKGVPLSFVDEKFSADLDAAKKNPLNYFYALANGGRKIFSYEEFLLLSSFVFAQYDSVYVVNNNIFMEQYPIEAAFGGETKKFLLEHFTEPEDESSAENLGNVIKLAEIFVGLRDCDNFLVGVYNDEKILSKSKVKVLNLFAPADVALDEIDSDDAKNFFDLQEETDFVKFVREIIFNQPEKIFVRTQNYTGDKENLDDRLKILGKYFSAQTKIFCVPSKKLSATSTYRSDYLEILKRYWRHEAFKNFKIYDTQSFYSGKKNTRDVSQEQIISDIVEQVELCMAEKDFRDVFVTAPTGAGKSVIFQVAATYLAEKENRLMTIVISPLIALMKNQVDILRLKNYRKAATINSETPPTAKDEIIQGVAKGEIDILYISPETLLSRNDVALLIGDRKIGLVVIDEAHIVTTWGKQFRPDYWYLGDYIRKLRKSYSFIIATFTATAIYGGPEDMYRETIDALHMIDPITYLGYVKRDDIEISICKTPAKNKSEDILKAVFHASIFKEKTLIYFPWVKLIHEENSKLKYRDRTVALYHGQLNKDSKQSSYERFTCGRAWVMLATKAFGMGIDIDDIKIVMHFAPTGNVCDYVQEIGRAARRKDLEGKAIYHYDSRDFKYINILHRLSRIHEYQLIEVIKKICELQQRRNKNNLMLDAENFSYIFGSEDDEEQTINKVKIALLIIQKDLEAKCSFPPITVRPWPLYSKGFFKTDQNSATIIQNKYDNCIEVVNGAKNIFCVNLKKIWEKNFPDKTFPNFKRMIYVRDNALPAELQSLLPVYIANITFKDNYRSIFKKIFDEFAAAVDNVYISKTSISAENLGKNLSKACNMKENYKAKNICELFFASMRSYSDNPKVIQPHSDDLDIKYSFTYKIKEYFRWFQDKFHEVDAQKHSGIFYITNNKKEFTAVLSILEAMGVLTFDIAGGLNNQLFIHINQISVLERIKEGGHYPNKILKDMERRHKISVAMLTYIYEGDFDNEKIWDLLEDYFLGKIPDEVRHAAL